MAKIYLLRRFSRENFFKIACILGPLFLLEAGAQVYYYSNHKELFYTHQKLTAASLAQKPPSKFLGYVRTNFILDPYFAFRLRSGLNWMDVFKDSLPHFFPKSVPPFVDIKSNNFGFFSPNDYPLFKKDEKEFIIGIFGGSVASYFSVIGSHRLVQRLQELPIFQGRKIIACNFGVSAFKQPQHSCKCSPIFFLVVSLLTLLLIWTDTMKLCSAKGALIRGMT